MKMKAEVERQRSPASGRKLGGSLEQVGTAPENWVERAPNTLTLDSPSLELGDDEFPRLSPPVCGALYGSQGNQREEHLGLIFFCEHA